MPRGRSSTTRAASGGRGRRGRASRSANGRFNGKTSGRGRIGRSRIRSRNPNGM